MSDHQRNQTGAAAKTAVLLVNWNGWQDTMACVQALCAGSVSPGTIVVCDNGSTDDSTERIMEAAFAAGLNPAGARACDEQCEQSSPPRFVLEESEENKGFASGVNACLNYVLKFPTVENIWVLNNDTIPDEQALAALLRCSERHPDAILGSTIVYDHDPGTLQCAGGCAYNPLTTMFSPAHGGARADLAHQLPRPRLDYVYGASFFARREVFEDVGLFNEEYFLFYEEMDFCRRAANLGYVPGWCEKSVVRHKVSASIKGGRGREGVVFANYHENLSTLLYTRRFHPWLLPFAMAFRFMGKLFFLALRREPDLVAPLLRAYKDFLGHAR